MFRCQWIACLVVVLALGSQVHATEPEAKDDDNTPGMTISLVYDVLIGQTFLKVDSAPPHTLQMSATMGFPSLQPILRHLAFASLTTSPALRAPAEEAATEEQEQPEEQETPLTPKQRYREMLRTTQPLDLVPVTQWAED